MKVTKIAVGMLAATLLFSACKQDKNSQADAVVTGSDAATSDAETPAPIPVESIVYINSDTLLTKYEYFKDVNERLKAKAEKTEKGLRNEAEAFQKEVARYQQTGGGMTNEQRANTEERLAQKQQMLQMKSQNAGNQMAKEESEEMKKLYDRVEDYLKKYSDEKGYKMVLTYSRGNSAILYSDSTLDVTSDVVKGLNEEYTAEKTAEAEKKETKKK
ncbi:OmpH family outer membrane protein [Botryobacter ruber]|uniref:OmpH family outer membrane protein n=1 Tax=Botryobacter ruber TaxID=2171629 RepID=UPI001F0CBAB6|nr:OmpH family outer membrane protein [Botryobacter ruber]